ncbi:hypothetical protein LTR56_001033 [Elasticomyces elasticus]|nr:hypothetical protein LTR22_013249 [Elasticomyces elasticus]KAK3660107.1 hypothetical protein LTR56_001033 [Elasticomyces elasticus]KAK4906989.1 hypothetical protein LTR49_023962 [Elasticomyces elasticus]KAK5747055.1 hypothetical protein LTS12_022475 [Elasticomyces elasticus]
MVPANQPFTGLIAPVSGQRPPSNFFAKYSGIVILRDNFTLTTLLCFGAIIQSLLFFTIGRLAVLPAVVYLLWRTLRAYAMTVGWLHNSYMDNVKLGKASAQFPDAEGNFSSKPADDDIVVFLIGTRVNHPMGLLAPGFKDLGDMFTQMAKDCDDHAEEFGFLGMTSWISNGLRDTNNELLIVGYFRTPEGLHNFAHSKYHTDAWAWWNTNHKTHPHLSIYHETYDVPKGHWETIYINSHPSHLGSASFKVYDNEKGEEVWQSGLVDASKGALRTSKGRMSRSKGDENDHFKEKY